MKPLRFTQQTSEKTEDISSNSLLRKRQEREVEREREKERKRERERGGWERKKVIKINELFNWIEMGICI